MANIDLDAEGSNPVESSGASFQFIFINEQERQEDPKSHQRTLVRSVARKSEHIMRQALNAANAANATHTLPIGLRKLKKAPNPATVVKTSWIQESNTELLVDQLPKDANVPVWQYLGSQGSSPQTIFSNGGLDPFNVFPIKIQPHLHHLFDYYVNFVAEQIPKNPETGRNFVQSVMPLFLTSQMAFTSMLCVAEIHFSGAVKGYINWTPFALRLMIDSVKHIRREIEAFKQDIDDAVILTIVNLAAIELLWGDDSKYRNHLKGLRDMVRLRGRPKSPIIGQDLRSSIVWAFQVGGESIQEEFENSNISSRMHQDSVKNSYASDSSLLISEKLIEVLKSVQVLSTAKNTVNTLPLNTIASDYRAMCVGIQHQLQAQRANSTLEDSLISATSVCVDLALLNTPLPKVATSDMNVKLTDALMKPNRAQNGLENDIAVFVLETTTNAQSNLSSLDQKRMNSLIEKFNKVLTQLQGLTIV